MFCLCSFAHVKIPLFFISFSIISSDELNVKCEDQVYNAIMSWVKYNVAERRQHLAHVLPHVRLSQLNAKFLVGTVGADLLVKSDEACRDLVDEAKNYLLLPQVPLLSVHLNSEILSHRTASSRNAHK